MKTILVIEDNPDIRDNICEILEIEGYRVIIEINGKSGISSAIENKPDLIVCDILMPEVDGYEVLNTLKNDDKTSGIPFIFATSFPENSVNQTTKEIRADGFIRKPFAAKELLETVRQLLAG